MDGFEDGAAKRAAFLEKQKKFKKAWRKELSNLEFASGDEEATEAIGALLKLINANGFEIPEGVRKMDLDQVYKAVQPKLSKGARSESLSRMAYTPVLTRETCLSLLPRH